MRALAVLLVACRASAPPPATQPPVRSDSGSAVAEPATDLSDPDEDRILGACDVCPDQKERVNDQVDDDGCPETDAEISDVSADPRNHYAGPLFAVQYTGDTPSVPLDRPWELDDNVEVVACVSTGANMQIAASRTKQLCKALEAAVAKKHPKVTVKQLSTTKGDLYAPDPHKEEMKLGGIDEARAVVQVLRAGGVDVWKWEHDQLVRLEEPRQLQSRPLPEGCRWQTFELDRKSGHWNACDSCPQLGTLITYRARWGSKPEWPFKE